MQRNVDEKQHKIKKTDPSTDYIVQTTLKRKQTDQIVPNKASCTQDESQLVTTKTLSNHRNILAITYDNQVYSNLPRHALASTLHLYDTLCMWFVQHWRYQ